MRNQRISKDRRWGQREARNREEQRESKEEGREKKIHTSSCMRSAFVELNSVQTGN